MTDNIDNKKLVPRLRFKEFENTWISTQLHQVLRYERPDKYIVNSTSYSSTGTPVLTANKSFILGYTDEVIGIYCDLPTIIFDDFTVDNKFVSFPFKVKSSAIKILKQVGNNNLKFIYESMQNIKFNATEHKRYYISVYQNLYVPMPSSFDEQQKIADCLSSIDNAIEAQTKKIEQLREHKKGLMQKLFPAKDSKLPELRFPEFQNNGDWEEKKLGEIAMPVSKRNADNLPITPLTLSSEFGLVSQKDYFDKTIASTNTKNYYIIQLYDFVYNDRITKQSQYGTIKCLMNYDTGIVSPIYKCFRLNKPENSHFWLYYFDAKLHEPEVAKLINEGARHGRFNISINDFLAIAVKEPKSKNTSNFEQQKIADCLTSLDKLIDTHKQKLELLNEHKTGLMQQMFPVVKR